MCFAAHDAQILAQRAAMLVADDDDDVFEETDAAAARYEDEDSSAPAEPSSEAAADDVAPDPSSIEQSDFSLLPLMLEVMQAHHARDVQAATIKMAALKRAVRRAETRLAVLQHATSQTLPSSVRAQEVLENRADLLARSVGSAAKRRKTA